NGLKCTYTDFPKARLTPGFIHFSETVLLDVFSANKETWMILKNKLEACGADIKTKQNAKDFVQTHKARLITELFGHHGYRDVSLQEQTDRETKFKLKGTVCTNGLVLHAMAYDTSVLRPKAAREAAEHGDPDNEEQDSEQPDYDADLEIDDAFIDLDELADDTDLNGLEGNVELESLEGSIDLGGLEDDIDLGSHESDIDLGSHEGDIDPGNLEGDIDLCG
ncbi:hypothetical protein BGZ65_000552, partial [Modicella reniformis]